MLHIKQDTQSINKRSNMEFMSDICHDSINTINMNIAIIKKIAFKEMEQQYAKFFLY